MFTNLRSLAVLLLALATLSAAAWQASNSPIDNADQVLPVLRNGPQYWKGNLHTHSYWSDGDDFPEMIADWYKRHGYQFLALSDHNILSEGSKWIDVGDVKGPRAAALKKYRGRFGEHWVEERAQKGKTQVRLKPLAEFRSVLEEPGKFLLIPAEEITHRFAKYPVHINAINLRDVIKPVDGASVAETVVVNLRAVAEQRKKTGGRIIAFVNHPNFGWGVRAEDLLAEELRFFEIFNGHPSVRNYGDQVHVSCEKMWDIVLALRLGKAGLPIVYGMATDDAHNYHAMAVGKSNPGRGWVMVRAPFLSAESLVTSLEAGDFYCSSGVTLKEIRRGEKQLTLVIQSAEGVTYKTQFIATLRDTPLDSEPRKDDKGKVLDVTRLYHADVGQVVAEVEGVAPTYRMSGKELYVRAKVMSTKAHPNPFQKGDVEAAWTQPVVP